MPVPLAGPMLPLPFVTVLAGLILLFLIALPLGATLLRCAEWFLGRRLGLSVLERVLLSFYGTGGLLFVVASLPLPLFGLPLVAGLLLVGILGYAVTATRDHTGGIRAAFVFVRSVPGVVVLVGSVILLGIEVSAGAVVLPNGIDGSVHALFSNLLLANHTVPWTLEPYAASGVIYPQGAPVWMALPPLLLGWPLVASPVVLPPLFLSLTPAAAFCLGQRLCGPSLSERQWMGLLFAGFFGVVASWPRLYVGGSYDFIFGLPLFLTVLGFVRGFANALHPWRETLLFGILLGATTALSSTVGTALALLLLGHWLVSARSGGTGLLRRLAGILASIGVAALFVIRSFVGVVVWWSYPGHVMTANSVPPYSPLAFQATYGNPVAEVDPFSPWKWKVSPFPLLTLELQVLLVTGLVLAGLVLTGSRGPLSRYLSPATAGWTIVSTGTLLLLTGVVGILGEWNPSLSGIQAVTNLWELSILLFTLYSLVAILPLVAGANYLRIHRWNRGQTFSNPGGHPPLRPGVAPRTRRQPTASPWPTILAAAVVVFPLATGLGVSATEMPGYLHSYILGQSNGTQDDVLALEWAGGHLPRCSGVLVAPGSAAQFLPEYATLSLIYPVYPTPTNLTYYTVVTSLTNGTYGTTTRAGLLALGVTEVFVTGATTNTYRAFSVAPLQSSADFSLLFSAGDALIFGFGPGIAVQNCPPT